MPPPRGGGALLRNLSDNSAHSEGSTHSQNAAENLSAEDQLAAEMQEQLLAGTLELDPENDPVICTTESGLEIKYAMAVNLGSGDKHTSSGTIGGLITSGGLNGYAYLKMGKYNWIIIGYNSSSTTVNVNYTYDTAVVFSAYLANPTAYNSFAGSLETDTDAGAMIASAGNNGIIWANWALSIALDYSMAVNAETKGLTELSSGEVLVLCQGTAGDRSIFGGNNIYYTNNTTYSTLCSRMRALYYPNTSNDAGFIASEAALIVPKTLTTAGSTSTKEYLFPLGSSQRASTESFKVETYLNGPTKRNIGCPWWLRSGNSSKSNYAYYLDHSDGNVYSYYVSPSLYYVRPAFVLKIT